VLVSPCGPCRLSISLHSTSLCSSPLIAVSSPAAFVGASNGPSLIWFDALSAEIRAISFHFVHLCCSRHRRAPVFLHRSVVAGSICRRFQQSKSRLSLAPQAAAIRDFFGSGFIYTQSVCVCLCVRACVSLRFLNVVVVLHGCFRVVCYCSCRYSLYFDFWFPAWLFGLCFGLFEALKKLSFIFVEDLSSAVGNRITAAARVSICSSLRVVDAISLAIVFSSYYCPLCVSVLLCRKRPLFPASEESSLNVMLLRELRRTIGAPLYTCIVVIQTPLYCYEFGFSPQIESLSFYILSYSSPSSFRSCPVLFLFLLLDHMAFCVCR
jgi:hypothetical protein